MEGQPSEIEAKFYLTNLDRFRAHVLSLGGTLLLPQVSEYNLRFDTDSGSLSASREVLRLRRDSQVSVTFKAPLIDFEQRHEIEVAVDSFEAAQALLEALGFEAKTAYEKRREVLSFGQVEVMLDQLPFGNFVEVEGPSLEAVAQASQALGLDWERRVRLTYLELFQSLRSALDLKFSEATFSNFAGFDHRICEQFGLTDAVNNREAAKDQA